MEQMGEMELYCQETLTQEQIVDIKETMRAKALAKKRAKTGFRLLTNIVVALIILLPLLYAVSIAFMPSGELFTTELNLFPKNPTLDNFKNAITQVPLMRFILNSFIIASCITVDRKSTRLNSSHVSISY